MVEELFDYLKQFNKGVKQGSKYNQYSSNPTYLKFNLEDVKIFNEIYQKLVNSNLNKIIRTKSGAIAKGPKNMSNNYAWDIIHSTSTIRLTITLKGYIFVFNVGSKHKNEIKVTPSESWKSFVKQCFEEKIDIYSYIDENGLKSKEMIPTPLISILVKDEELSNVHHIDFHNSYPAGLVNTHPEFRPVIEYFYNKRKEDEKYKAVLNFSIGCMQSLKHPWKAQWAHLAKDAIEDNNKRLSHLAFQLEINGRKLIGFNTDGVWYQGEIYHGEGEGDKLGEWHNDHINCKFRARSDGVYEFLENGKYTPVVRGTSTLDAIEPDRSTWKWGDIYRQELLKFKWQEGVGIVYED